ncbi:MAG: group II intron reverse transcriptase domain-containing protein [Planctomycetales bacterium]|nr:group II intron reverse transcriptase domain-containing protein [Planctomycetales bacterium]
MPFVGYDVEEPRYKAIDRQVQIKRRPIRFAAHLDSHIFAYYASLLMPLYEAELVETGLGRQVVAYRTHPEPKCNIHFANDAFEWIKRRKQVVAFAIDIEGFFDSISHGLLKERWQAVLNVSTLPKDHYKVFRAITKYAWVSLNDLKSSLGFGRSRLENSRKPFCTPQDFRRLIAKEKKIRVNEDTKGIPQGSPISALLSNIAMLHFDKALNSFVTERRGVYRRYSDDILVVLPTDAAANFEDYVDRLLKQTTRSLSVNRTKTVISSFKEERGSLTCDIPLSYLGFEFDGIRKTVRPKTLARFHRRMIQGIRSAKRAALKAKKFGADSRIRKRDLYERYSHLGKRNFVSYAYRAATIMEAPEIRRQVRKHWHNLNHLITEAQTEVDEK